MENVVWFLTGNAGKVEEARHHFAPLGYEVRQLKVEDDAIVEPQAADLETVAQAKLNQAMAHLPSSSSMMLVEDAGLFVDALNGFPGVFSAHAMNTIGTVGVLRLLSHLSSEDPVQSKRLRAARFEAVAVLWNGERTVVGHGVCPGSIATESHGEGGFGFDPIFIPADLDADGEALPP
ncbi:MAG: hypothetical protein ISP84_00320, partial [Candidatus Poseidonia sp.]|nr:hypothetical protein [Poseidonia sp.]